MHNQKNGFLIQARMNSTRLPGKVLMNLHGKPILAHIIDRIHELKMDLPIIIITSDTTKDDLIEDFCTQNSVLFFRGEECDVLDRYYRAAKYFNLEHIVRLTGDNPLVDSVNLKNLLTEHLTYDADYSSNKSEIESGLPIGVGAEIFRFSALAKSWRQGTKPHHREHVDEYILENPHLFRIRYVKGVYSCSEDCNKLRLTIDTFDDFVFVDRIFTILAQNHMKISLDSICSLVNRGLIL